MAPLTAVDLLVFGAAHLVVRTPAPPHDVPAYRVLSVSLDVPAFRDAVLLARPDVLPGLELLDALRVRWAEAEAASREMAAHARAHVPNQYPTWAPGTAFAREPTDWAMVAKIRHGALSTLQRWLALCPHEFVADTLLFEAAHGFVDDAAAECDATPADAPRLANLIETLRAAFAQLVRHTVAQYAYDAEAAAPAAPEAHTPAALAAYLESVVAPLYAGVSERDIARAARSLARVAPRAWCAVGHALGTHGAPPTWARLVRLLPAPATGDVERGSVLDALPASVRALCDAYDTIAAWAESYVVDVRLDAEVRQQRMRALLGAVGAVRAQMARKVGGSLDGPIPASLVESAVLDGLAAPASLAYRAAWEEVAGTQPTLREHVRPPPEAGSELGATPDIFWLLAWLATCALQLPLETHSGVVSLAGAMAVRDVAHAAHALRDPTPCPPAALAHAGARLAWLRDAVSCAAWPLPSAPETSAAVAAPVPRLFAALVEAREQKARTLAAYTAPRTPEAPVRPATPETACAPSPHTVCAAPPAPSDALLAAVPTTRAASTFPCTGASVRVWPFERHPFVFELVLPSAMRCTLKVPDYASFCAWLARLQSLPHVRLDASFDAGEYAAQVAEHEGRASVAALFEVPLRELYLRTGHALPPAIECLLHEIETRGIHEQGIYRISGAKHAVDALKRTLRRQPTHALALARIDIHVVASTVKLWLRELPEPVVPYAFYHRLMDTEEISDPMQRVRAMSRVVRAFPCSHYVALERLAAHLATIARASKWNWMAPHNIGLVFGSTLLSPPPGVQSLAENFQRLGKAAHVVKILVVMHRHVFATRGSA